MTIPSHHLQFIEILKELQFKYTLFKENKNMKYITLKDRKHTFQLATNVPSSKICGWRQYAPRAAARGTALRAVKVLTSCQILLEPLIQTWSWRGKHAASARTGLWKAKHRAVASYLICGICSFISKCNEEWDLGLSTFLVLDVHLSGTRSNFVAVFWLMLTICLQSHSYQTRDMEHFQQRKFRWIWLAMEAYSKTEDWVWQCVTSH